MKNTLEIIYTWPGGREEVRYRRAKDSEDAIGLMKQIDYNKMVTSNYPYSYRFVNDVEENNEY